MSVRRKNAQSRLFLIRTCRTCGKVFRTSANTPWIRQIANVDGKKQKTCYFCSQTCKQKSYKHLFDGKAEQRKAEHEKNRDIREKNRRYYEKHAEQIKAKAKERYWADPESSRANNRYSKQKRKMIENELSV